jgi:predicted HTH transcriptional regulator
MYPSYNAGGVTIANDSEEYWSGVIESGESYYVEFKNSLHFREKDSHEDFLESVIAFSNSDGGVIIIGVGDHGEKNGIGDGEIKQVVELIDQLVYSCIEPKIDMKVKVVTLENKKYIVVEVDSGKETPYFSKGKTIGYVRRGSTDKLLDRNTLDSLTKKNSGGLSI